MKARLPALFGLDVRGEEDDVTHLERAFLYLHQDLLLLLTLGR